MNRLTLIALISVALTAAAATAAEPDGGLSPDQVRSLLQSVRLDAPTRAAMNAVTNNDIKDLVLNREITATSDDVFSFSLPTKGITDQENTGRCWLFAGMNMLRQGVVKRYKLEDFELSQSYMAFWDRLEKSNVFLEFIIETRTRDLMDREVDHMLDEPVDDGGYWGYVVGLVEKYGVLPKKFMGETKSSSNTERMDIVFQSLLRRDASVLRELTAQGQPVEALRAEKMKMLQDVMRLLVINYGEPPGEFLWRVTSDSGVVTETHTYTPQQFYHEVIATDLADYVSLADFPVHPYQQHYSIRLTKAMADRPDIDFVNVDVKRMKEIALAALLDSQRVWFGCDMGFDVSGKKGLMVKGLVDYESLFGVPLGMTKTQRLNYRHSSSNHAMVLVGVDMVDGKPHRWRVENSWGDERGDKGFFTMSDDWFDEYVLNVIVPRKYVPKDLLAVLRQPPTELPVWDPAWQQLRW
ncbi:MAG: C1 family peptidase [bacterium]|nr:C1 family peptidase [bacterium]